LERRKSVKSHKGRPGSIADAAKEFVQFLTSPAAKKEFAAAGTN
jgi:ABC-type glycerol-3-phosphate transport system substrate-binding protein